MTRNVGIFLFDDVEVLDFAGPFEVFHTASRVKQRLEPDTPKPFYPGQKYAGSHYSSRSCTSSSTSSRRPHCSNTGFGIRIPLELPILTSVVLIIAM